MLIVKGCITRIQRPDNKRRDHNKQSQEPRYTEPEQDLSSYETICSRAASRVIVNNMHLQNPYPSRHCDCSASATGVDLQHKFWWALMQPVCKAKIDSCQSSSRLLRLFQCSHFSPLPFWLFARLRSVMATFSHHFLICPFSLSSKLVLNFLRILDFTDKGVSSCSASYTSSYLLNTTCASTGKHGCFLRIAYSALAEEVGDPARFIRNLEVPFIIDIDLKHALASHNLLRAGFLAPSLH